MNGILFANLESKRTWIVQFEGVTLRQFAYLRIREVQFPVFDARQSFAFIRLFIAKVDHQIDELWK